MPVKPLINALDHLENRFLARKTLRYIEGPGEDLRFLHWYLADQVMQFLTQCESDDEDVEAVRQLIAARYLVVQGEEGPGISGGRNELVFQDAVKAIPPTSFIQFFERIAQ